MNSKIVNEQHTGIAINILLCASLGFLCMSGTRSAVVAVVPL